MITKDAAKRCLAYLTAQWANTKPETVQLYLAEMQRWGSGEPAENARCLMSVCHGLVANSTDTRFIPLLGEIRRGFNIERQKMLDDRATRFGLEAGVAAPGPLAPEVVEVMRQNGWRVPFDKKEAPQCPEEQESLERLAGITPTTLTDKNTSI